MLLLLGACETAADSKVGLRSSWWNTLQDFSQVEGKWILLTLLFSVKLVKQHNCLNHTEHSRMHTHFMWLPLSLSRKDILFYLTIQTCNTVSAFQNLHKIPNTRHVWGHFLLFVNAEAHCIRAECLGWIPERRHGKIRTETTVEAGMSPRARCRFSPFKHIDSLSV